MKTNQDLFRLFLKVFKLYGLIDSSLPKALQVFNYCMLYGLEGSLFVSAVIFATKAKNVEDVSNVILFTPAVVMIVCCAINVSVKQVKIIELVEHLKQIFSDKETDSFEAIAFKRSMLYLKITTILSFATTAMSAIEGFINQKLNVPVWLPFDLMEDPRAYFVILCLENGLSTLYCSLISHALTTIPICFIFIIGSYGKFVQSKLRSVKDRESLIEWMELREKFIK